MAVQNNSVEYFSHDKHMRHDPKINALRLKFPGWGYSVWCMLLEEFCNQKDRRIEWNELNRELLAADFMVDLEILDAIVDYAVKIDLLQINDGVLMSRRFQERFESLDNKREMKSEAGKKGAAALWKKRNTMAPDGSAMAEVCECLDSEMQEKSIVEKSREEKSKETSSSFSSSSKPEEKVDPQEEEQQQEIISNFFFRNFTDPSKEFEKFVSWNNCGGRKWADMDKDQRLAAAMQWQQKDKHSRFNPTFLQMWCEVYTALDDNKAPLAIRKAALDDKLRWEDKRDGCYILWCPKALYDFIEEEDKIHGFLSVLKPIISKYYTIRRLSYQFTD